MSIFEKMSKAFGKKSESNKSLLEEQLKEKLKSLVYDEELVTELLPVFMKLQGVEGFASVMELLESKEKQVEMLTGGEWFKQESEDKSKTIETNQEQEDEDTENLVDSYLSNKYKETK